MTADSEATTAAARTSTAVWADDLKFDQLPVRQDTCSRQPGSFHTLPMQYGTVSTHASMGQSLHIPMLGPVHFHWSRISSVHMATVALERTKMISTGEGGGWWVLGKGLMMSTGEGVDDEYWGKGGGGVAYVWDCIRSGAILVQLFVWDLNHGKTENCLQKENH